MRVSVALLALLGGQLLGPVRAQPPPEPVADPVVTYHSVHIGGERLQYAATVSETVLRDDSGQPAATIFSTAYVREHVRDTARRPVLFAFNGGPGSSSDQLHLQAFGPRRRSRSGDIGSDLSAPDGIIDNPESLLNTADLVFVDPVGTGFSRVLPGGDGGRYWSVAGDAQAMAGFIQEWLNQHQRTRSPLYICGESYGGIRLATLLATTPALAPAGALFISPALDFTAMTEVPGNDMPYLLTLPSMAAIAWYHNRVERGGKSVQDVFNEAVHFAESDYAPALLQGSQLPEADKQRIAGELARRIGLPPELILKLSLRVGIEDFVTRLLANKGLRVGRTDGRYTGVAAELAKRSPPFNDPAIAPGGSAADLVKSYLTGELKFATSRDYITLAMDVNMRWNWTTLPGPGRYATVMPSLTKAMRENTRLRVFIASGYYDLATPAFATSYAFAHADLPSQRLTWRYYESGHTMYQSEASRRELAADIRSFIVELQP